MERDRNGTPVFENMGGYLMPQYTSYFRPVKEIDKVFRSLPIYGANEKLNNKQEDNTMEMGNFMQGMFGSVKGGLCRLTVDGGIAVKVPTGYKTYNPAQKAFVNCDNFVFDIGDEMFFVIPTNTVAVGDIILVSGEPRYVLDVKEDMLTVINYKNGTVENIMPERHMFMGNTYFYGKIMSLFGNMGSTVGVDGAQNVMKYMMMSQMCRDMGGRDSGGMNPMMMMMMMQGGGMGNMFDNLFKATAPAAPAVATPEVKEGE